MGTRATIKFNIYDEEYYVYRGHDGFPDIILDDIQKTIEKSKNRWSEPELNCLITLFLAMGYDYNTKRLPTYEITSGFHGDESYKYYVRWSVDERKWKYGVIQ